MMTKLFALFSALMIVSTGSAQDWARAKLDASPRHQDWVEVKHDGRTVKCLVVYPEVKNPAPAVLVIQEIYGLSDWLQELTDELAAAGYVAIAPDLLSGVGGGTEGLYKSGGTSAVTKAVGALPPEQVMADLDAVADYVTHVTGCNGELMVGGFCWGGGKSFAYATHRKDLKAAFVFYGVAPKPEDMVNIHCPVYGFYAENDARITAAVPAATSSMKAAGKTYEPVIYAGAGHGFMRAGEDPTPPAADKKDMAAANKKARDDAWVRWLKLLKDNG